MTRKELYKKLNGKKVVCKSKTRFSNGEKMGIFKSGRMSFTIKHIQPLKRIEYSETKYFLYKNDEIQDLGECILIRRNAIKSKILIFVA